MSVQKPPAVDAHGHAPLVDGTPPELVEADFLSEVLQVQADDAESFLDDLLDKAARLGISLSRPSTALSTADKPTGYNTSGADSSVTLDTSHARTTSTGSQRSVSTTLTAPSSTDGNILRHKTSRSLTFAQYEKYLSQINPNLNQPKFLADAPPERYTPVSLFSVSTEKSYLGIRNGLSKMRRRRKPSSFSEAMTICCSACREDFKRDQSLEKLPCGHRYCTKCLRIMIIQSATDESKMPPRCCTQSIPGQVVKSILTREEQSVFLKAVLQFSTPWEARVFCCNPACGEFIPPRNKIDPKYPSQATCRKCRTRVCVMCKRSAHPLGQDCPDDWELDAVLKMGERSGWRRCYKCRTLVELTQGCTHMTCRCRAQFCYICGAVWEPAVGCPNFCNGEAEMERRRQEEQERMTALEAEEAVKQEAAAKDRAERLEAEKRTKESPEFQALRADQKQEMTRFQMFERKSKWLMWTRHAQQKLALVEKHSAMVDKMSERHAKTSANLEDRQVVAEMELRSTLEQSERNVRIRLKYMEAYCDGLGQKPNASMPSRVVTERDLRELGQQYNVEKNMKQLHQAKINVMRDRQAKALEELLERQEKEMDRLVEKNNKEIENLESDFVDEEDILTMTFNRRRSTIEKRWELSMKILRKEMESEKGGRFSVLEPLEWPYGKDLLDDGLSPVEE
ncbi:uncharacterized protein BCR38DRAFT_337342 [Pseudomassariella vexata]|uniref:RBR-type E3 ubiquitin transferase n=1 Tax=Pseudomassariella vexata TaxID=1141098 RepID=A0A1Y2E715_9PEZI|nr:uncharacterized protein BCR38DRAFT_337342 [Pseudomassariella vexata]ORY67309.1 hypothetical protein BCR38DRAFT_337342 [Pseudomassariella vexata]